MSKEYATVIIKPDSVRDVLDLMIIEDLLEAGMQIVWRKQCYISKNLVSIIYAAQVNKPVYESAIRALTFGPSIVLLVEGEEVFSRLRDIKGKMDKGGLRLKYRLYSRSELEEIGYSGQELQDILAENRIHTAENFFETIAVCASCMSFSERESLLVFAPSLYGAVKKMTEIALVNFIPNEQRPSK